MWKKILGGIVLFIILVIALVMWLTSGMTEAADEFFIRLKKNNIDQAYEMTSEEFRSSTSMDEFKSFLSQTSLDEFKEASWSSRKRTTGGQGVLEGTITTEDGGNIPLTVTLVKENEEWKVLNVEKAKAGMSESDSDEKEVPEEEALKELVHDTMISTAQSLEKENFSTLYNDIAKLWRDQKSEEEFQEMMNKNFKSFLENDDIDLMKIEGKEPVFNQEATINEDGLLVVNGYYTIEPEPANFELRYAYENGNWKLIGINVQM